MANKCICLNVKTSYRNRNQQYFIKKLSDKAHYVYLAETVVVKETQSSAKVSGVVPVMSSHCAGDVPPTRTRR